MSLRARLTWSFLVVILATTALVGGLTNRILANRFVYLVSVRGQNQAQRLAPLFERYYAAVGSWAGVDEFVAEYFDFSTGPPPPPMGGHRRGQMGMMALGPDERLLVVNAEGEVIADSDAGAGEIALSAEDLRRGTGLFVGGRRVGTLVVASALGTLSPEQKAFLRQVNQLMVVAALLAGLAVLAVSAWQARTIVAPVEALAQAARRIAAGDFSQRVPTNREDELGTMAAAFNAMAEELEQQRDLRHRTMADVAHELRTPLSVLQIDLESLEDGLLEPTPEVVSGLQSQVAHLGRLVEDLRLISLAEAGELPIDLERLDAVALVSDVAGRVRNAAREKGVALALDLPPGPLWVSADPQRLAQVLLNLLANALQHTPAGGEIGVGARRETGTAQIFVADTGEGIAPEDLPHVFDRFYRAGRSRSRDAGGSGLGLSIARTLVEAHGGQIRAAGAPGAGATFTVILPLVAA